MCEYVCGMTKSVHRIFRRPGERISQRKRGERQRTVGQTHEFERVVASEFLCALPRRLSAAVQVSGAAAPVGRVPVIEVLVLVLVLVVVVVVVVEEVVVQLVVV